MSGAGFDDGGAAIGGRSSGRWMRLPIPPLRFGVTVFRTTSVTSRVPVHLARCRARGIGSSTPGAGCLSPRRDARAGGATRAGTTTASRTTSRARCEALSLVSRLPRAARSVRAVARLVLRYHRLFNDVTGAMPPPRWNGVGAARARDRADYALCPPRVTAKVQDGHHGFNDRSKIVDINIETEMKTSYIDYSMRSSSRARWTSATASSLAATDPAA